MASIGKSTMKIGKVTYTQYDDVHGKENASKTANKLRAMGYKVKIVSMQGKGKYKNYRLFVRK